MAWSIAGAVIPTALSSDEAGEWSESPGGELVWRLALSSPGALSLGVLFDRFELPAGGELYLYDRARTSVLGAFTAAVRQENGMLAVQPLLGDELVIEYVQPSGVLARPVLRVGEVVHDYRGILDRIALDTPVGVGGARIERGEHDRAALALIRRRLKAIAAPGHGRTCHRRISKPHEARCFSIASRNTPESPSVNVRWSSPRTVRKVRLRQPCLSPSPSYDPT